MPVTSERHTYSPISRSVGHGLHVLLQRLRRANLPLLVAFISALFMFLRALSGAGYVDPHAQLAPMTGGNYTHLAAADSNNHGYGGFAGHWARFKETFLSCPADSSIDDDTGLLGIDGDGLDVEAEGIDREATDSPAAVSKKPLKVGVGCLKERLSGVIGLRKPSGPAVKQEDRAFKVSLDGFPLRRKGDAEAPGPTSNQRSR